MAWLGVRDASILARLDRTQLHKLKTFLKDVVVRVREPRDRMPIKSIVDIVPEAGLQEFDNKEGERITVQVRRCARLLSRPKLNLGSPCFSTATL